MAKKTSSKNEETVLLEPMDIRTVEITIEGTTPLIQHRFTTKAKRGIEEGQKGETKTRRKRDKHAEMEDCLYLCEDGTPGVPVGAIKGCITNAAHTKLGIDKTLVRQALFIVCDDPTGNIPLDASDPVLREDYVRIGRGTIDMRYRPQFTKWKLTFVAQFDASRIGVKDVFRLVDRAGFGVGLHEWRPQKNGEYGRFQICNTE